MNKKKVVIYAGALLTALILIGVSSVSSVEKDSGCNRIYDVNRDSNINFQDVGLCYVYYRDSLGDEYGDLLYDVNIDGNVDQYDWMEIWHNRD